jgi:hypothetical protein
VSNKEKGLRFDKGKPQLMLVPASTIYAIAEVLEEGAKKYSADNWRKGMPWSKVINPALRHIYKFLDPRQSDFDEETGKHHLKHALTNLSFLVEYIESCPELDDRYKGEE